MAPLETLALAWRYYLKLYRSRNLGQTSADQIESATARRVGSAPGTDHLAQSSTSVPRSNASATPNANGAGGSSLGSEATDNVAKGALCVRAAPCFSGARWF
ncbi:MAG: hypothetical protein IPI51_04670 [Betaproteobacteria bacterium]|nr:hypothetical protein [Betaproteobacteria bacterium]MBK9682344.1 hypothetical protein [Betaproteobacteria bacterium]MBL0299506.1 hypothetical protein [Betaproteobacteria bacterium]